jgi:hypothetical protein
LLILSVAGTTVTNEWSGYINKYLGLSSTKIVEGDGSEDPIHFKSDFTNYQDVMKNARSVAKQVQAEGTVLMTNKNNALPLNKGSKVTFFSYSSADVAYGSTGSGGVAASDERKIDLVDACTNDSKLDMNMTMYNFYKGKLAEGYKASKGALTRKSGGGSGANVNDFLIDSGSSQSQVVDNSSSGSTQVNQTVASGSRAKRTNIIGNGQDQITIMVYMCGTDLESKYGMGTSDLQEMLGADLGDNINLIVYTGGCKQWKNSVISSDNNQIYQVTGGTLKVLSKNEGEVAMTDPDTLADFIKYCDKKFPANRNMLIFWDHGGGSISGYGYDEKFARTGSMDLAEINEALK